MNRSRLWAVKVSSNGYGWRLMPALVRLWAVTGRDHSAASSQALWQSMPPVYRQCAVIYSDFWSAYPIVLTSLRHRAVGKETGNTSYRRAIQLHATTTGVATGEKNIVLFKKVRKSQGVQFGISSITTMLLCQENHPYLFSTTLL